MSGNETILTTQDSDAWRHATADMNAVFASLGYARIQEEFRQVQAYLFCLESDQERIVYPFLERPVSDLPFVQQMAPSSVDIVSPEYTGPLSNAISGHRSEALSISFRDRFHQYCIRHHIIAEFVHLNPWAAVEDALDRGDISVDRPIIYVDLTQSMDRLWNNSFNHACRKNISKAEREDVKVFHSRDPRDIVAFYEIYLHTMNRNQADPRYYYPLEYFQQFVKVMPEESIFFFARYQGEIVAATLYLYDKESVYSYLGGANHDYQHVRPTNAVIYSLIQWAQAKKIRRLVLGGGYEKGDGIYRFKSTFSPLLADFKIYKKIHLTDEYNRLCESKYQYDSHHSHVPSSNGYFPAYRDIKMTNEALQ